MNEVSDGFVVITVKSKNIDDVIKGLFHRHNGKLPKGILSQTPVETFEGVPFIALKDSDKRLAVYKNGGFNVYKLREGIVYEN